jgi:ERCC4-type nuclease
MSVSTQIASSAVSKTAEHVIDIRERHLIPLLPSFEVQTMAIGDIQVGNLLIERKTVKDFEASVLDGRYREQKTRLLATCQEKSLSPLYILEGPLSSTTGRLQVPAIMKLVARLQYKHGIPVIQTGGLEETATLVKALADYYTEDPTNFVRSTEPLRAVDSVHVVKKVNANDPKQFMMAALAQCPGVSIKMAEAIHTAFPSWTALMGADEKGLEMIVQANGRKVGPVVAKRLFALLRG